MRTRLVAATLAALIAALIFVPWHRSVSSDGVIELGETQVLRAECPGFVVHEYVQDGEIVTEGQLLLDLSNDEAASDLTGRRLAVEQQDLRVRKSAAEFQMQRGLGTGGERPHHGPLPLSMLRHENPPTLNATPTSGGRITSAG